MAFPEPSLASSVSTMVPATFHPFPRLPTETRTQIWAYSFEPRVLTIRGLTSVLLIDPRNLDSGVIELPWDPRDPNWRRKRTLLVKTFIVFEGAHSDLKAMESWVGGSAPSGHVLAKQDEPIVRAPMAPVALYICRESRTMALARYALGFGAIQKHSDSPHRLGDSRWEEHGMIEKTTWVDWERDTIMIPLYPCRRICLEDNPLIQRLAVMEREMWLQDLTPIQFLVDILKILIHFKTLLVYIRPTNVAKDPLHPEEMRK
ncbi:uncharacterized protein LY89DRAFT_274078 [Mollisia scopiformis]|uniref:2EXR domain-containing protein n=1 Tax=Mollisia scopiformis TaxID=149040 RepID=A0A132BB18_MOLSC|nr:uncharacterized protein LY89DRAFT_274078 [Mollisia scopiformis]KUJ09612.1 hypothetical protein LY89DRAFT_274078 [Mollisia scopiformis]